MHIKEIHIAGFRCFSPDTPFSLKLRQGLNILVGPNDAGKTAVIDAIRFVLWSRGDDFLRLESDDFFLGPDGRAKDLLIRCTFDGLTPDEEARFLEWCTNEAGTLRLHVCLRATCRQLPGGGKTVLTMYRAGVNGDGPPLEGELREYLKSTYLKPLRDAARELRSGRRSRLSRILGALPAMATQADPGQPGQPETLRDTVLRSDNDVEANDAIREVQESVNVKYLDSLSFSGDRLRATLGLGAKGSFDQLLERLELYLNPRNALPEQRVARGLGYNNLLFMAAELLLLQSHPDQVPFILIEEPEAHLHPQHQTLFMQVLEERAAPTPEGETGQQVQVLLSTHSPHLAAGAELDAMVMMIEHKAYPLNRELTKLGPDDYAFLQRFLDATKANLFFARGLIIVEGDAENILLPAIAKKIGKPFGKHGVSIVKVGHRGLFRYSRIFQRTDDSQIPISVALIPDRDIPPDSAKKLIGRKRKTESEWDEDKKRRHLGNLEKDAGGCVRAFPSVQWTLEYDLARSPLCAALVHQAAKLVKGERGKTREEIAAAATAKVKAWQAAGDKSDDDIATLVFAPMAKKSGLSKAEVAQQLAILIEKLPDDEVTFRGKLPAYIVEAIDYVTGSDGAPEEQQLPPEAQAAE